MAWVYELRTFDAQGIEKHRVSDFISFKCTLRVNSPGLLVASLPTSDSFDRKRDTIRKAVINDLQHRSLVELWCKNDELGIAWHRYFGGYHLKKNQSIPERFPTFSLTSVGYPWLLSTRIINWPANMADRTMFINKTTCWIMTQLLTYNVGSLATTSQGRKRAGTLTETILTSFDQYAGTAVDWYCFGETLLETFQKLTRFGGFDFSFDRTDTLEFTLNYHPGQLGTDRSTAVLFSMDRGNLGFPSYELNRIDEATVACVWGRGEGPAREYVTRTGLDYSSSNDVEIFVNASSAQTTNALNSTGDQKLYEKRKQDRFGFEVIQTPSCQYKVHYFLGDKITLINPFTDEPSVQKITATTVTLNERGAPITEIEVSTP